MQRIRIAENTDHSEQHMYDAWAEPRPPEQYPYQAEVIWNLTFDQTLNLVHASIRTQRRYNEPLPRAYVLEFEGRKATILTQEVPQQN